MIVIDTCRWLWLVEHDPRLRPVYWQRIQEHQATGLLVSAISCWEIGTKVRKGKLPLCKPEELEAWMHKALHHPGIVPTDITPEIATRSTLLEWAHADPWDRIIVATAQVLDIPLLTVDEEILKFTGVRLAVTNSQSI